MRKSIRPRDHALHPSKAVSTATECAAVEIREDKRGNVSFDIADGIRLVWGDTVLVTAAGKNLLPLSRHIETHSPLETRCRFDYEGGLEVGHMFFHEATSRLRVVTRISGKGAKAASLARAILGRDTRVESSVRLDRIFWQTEAMDGFGGVEAAKPFTSWGMAALTRTSGSPSVLAGFADFSDFHSEVSGTADPSGTGWQLSFPCELEGRIVGHDHPPLQMPDLIVRAGESLALLLDEYAQDVGRRMGARDFPASPRGWCSWYCYYGTESEEDILKNLESFSDTPLAGSGAIFQIDDGWNLPFAGHARVWGDWHPGAKFPQGMARIAQVIREKNLTPGLWLAPFSVDKASKLAREHPEWLVQERDPASGEFRPASASDGFALDLTREDVLQFIRSTFRRIFSEWGFDYVKIDFLKHAVTPGIRQDASVTSRRALRNALRIIREEAGSDRFILCCGCPFGPAIGLCDSMRIGMDVGGGWDSPLVLPQWPDGNCCVKAAAKPAFYRHWMHRRWWINDPDCLVVRQSPLACEVEELTKIARRLSQPARPPRFCLTDEEADFWICLVSLLGGSLIFSEIWDSLPPKRQSLLARALIAKEQVVRWIDWYQNPDLCFLKTVKEPLRIGIFNFSDQICAPTLPASKLGLSTWHFEEDSGKESFTGTGSGIEFPPLPPHSARIWRLGSPSGKAASLRKDNRHGERL